MRQAWVDVAVWLSTFSLTVVAVVGIFALFPVPPGGGC